MSECENPIIGYRSGSGRNPGEERLCSHTYAEFADGDLAPMCGYGWNRSNGSRLSIIRGALGTEGDCLLCLRNRLAGKAPVTEGWPHKTKWL